jgi:hypothetical protein
VFVPTRLEYLTYVSLFSWPNCQILEKPEKLVKVKHTSLFVLSISNKEKCFYSFVILCQCFKLFFVTDSPDKLVGKFVIDKFSRLI